MAYGFYQPKILQKVGFVNLASTLDILQGIMGAIAFVIAALCLAAIRNQSEINLF